MANYLLELGCEEIPARFMTGFLEEIKSRMSTVLKQYRLHYEDIKTWGTYRRLIVKVEGVPIEQEDLNELIKGPPEKIAFDSSSHPLAPAIGFAKRMGVEPTQLIRKDGMCFAKRYEKGKKTIDVLPDLVSECLLQWPLPIAMKWGTETVPFFRPIHWMVSLLDDVVVPLTLWDITASNVSYGHRMLSQNPDPSYQISGAPILVQSSETLLSQLREYYVEPDPSQRRSVVVEAIQNEPVDEALLEELVFLSEWPKVLTGRFDKSYLEIPQIALKTCMQKHQKYIPKLDEKGQMQSSFWVVADSVTDENKAQIIAGNENVLRARLEDLKFFWEDDLNQKMSVFQDKLKRVVFQKNLGSMSDKLDRIEILAKKLNSILGLGVGSELIERAASFSKVDLVTSCVIELPELQGVMGRYLLEKQGELDNLSKVAEQHYWPKFMGDKLPESPLADLISISDKVDTISACFVNKLNPTGSQDPWGVRRAVLGILQIIKEKHYSLDLQSFMTDSFHILSDRFDQVSDIETSLSNCLKFIAQRFEQNVVDQGISKEIVQAVSQSILTNYQQTVIWAKLIQEAQQSSETFKALSETANRVANLAKKHKINLVVNEDLFQKSIEREALNALIVSESVMADGRFESAPSLNPFEDLVPLLTRYFEQVMVMDEDLHVQGNRLAFMIRCHHFFSAYINWERL